jgi:ABC-type lipoprotein release transport system permease subunit
MTGTFRLAWRNLWRQPRRTWLTTGAMVFSNVLLVFMISLQLGMYKLMVDNTLKTFTGHLQVQHPGYKDDLKMRQTVPAVRALAESLRADLDPPAVAARASAFALASSDERSYGVQIVGVEPGFESRVSTLPGLIGTGRYLSDPGAPEIVVGSVLARNLKAGIGDELTLLGSGRDGSFAAAVVTIVGTFDSGMPDLDRGFAQVPLPFFQDTFAMGDAGHSVVIAAPDLFRVAGLQRQVESRLPPGPDLVVRDWDALQPGLKQAIQADFFSAWFMYGVLVVLVAFSVLNTQLMSVLERTKEFGIVMALGLTPGRLGRLVILETTLMALLGLLLGALLGGLVTYWFGVHGFTYPGLDEMAGKFNLPDRIYPTPTLISLFLGPVFVFLGCLLAAVYPAARLFALQPVEAMRAA